MATVVIDATDAGLHLIEAHPDDPMDFILDLTVPNFDPTQEASHFAIQLSSDFLRDLRTVITKALMKPEPAPIIEMLSPTEALEVRQSALDQARSSYDNAPAAKIVEAAKAFEAYLLTGKGQEEGK